jgi:DNA primase
MGLIPQHFIDDLLAKTDIVELINQRVPLKKQGREYAACCPFHNEKTPSFTVSPEKQFYHCFGCGAHGSAISFMLEYENLDFVEAVEELATTAGMEIPREQDTPANGKSQGELQPLFDVLTKASRYFQQQLKAHPNAIDYLKRRRLTGETVRDFIIGYAPDGWDNLLSVLSHDTDQRRLHEAGLLSSNDKGRVYDKFRDRIIFPIRDSRGRVVAFGARIIGKGEPKYLNSPESPVFNKSKTLYGLFEARKSSTKLDHLIIVEGYMDVVMLAQFGIHNAVATLGTATTPDHLRLIFRSVKRVVFCFDGDRAGREAAWRALTQTMASLRDGYEIGFLFLPEGEDPDSFIQTQGADTFKQATKQATPLSAYLIDSLKSRHTTTSPEGRTSLAEEARKLLSPLAPGMLRTQIETELAKLTHQKQLLTLPERAFLPPKRPRHSLEVTPMRLAVAALLQHPKLGGLVLPKNDTILGLLPGGTLLISIAKTIRAKPELNSAMLIERYRGTKFESVTHQLMEWQPPKPEEQDWEVLLEDALNTLKKHAKNMQLNELLQRSQHEALSEKEKRVLQMLLSS